LDKALKDALSSGANLTILAPSNNAFQKFKPSCSINLKNILLDHVLTKWSPPSSFSSHAHGASVRSMCPC